MLSQSPYQGLPKVNMDIKSPKNVLIYTKTTAEKMKISIKDFFSKCDQIPRKILNGKLRFLCTVNIVLLTYINEKKKFFPGKFCNSIKDWVSTSVIRRSKSAWIKGCHASLVYVMEFNIISLRLGKDIAFSW